MENKNGEKTINPLGKTEPEFKLDVLTFIFAIVGGIISWFNMLLILNYMEVWAYLSIIFVSSVPGVIIAYKNRYWGYGFMFGFAIAGIPFMIIDLFIGGYTFATTLFIFIIMWLLFWKAWRSLSSIKITDRQNQ
ncbi:MAG TPA: hypothetical protein VGB37_10250 [Candidatus Lokiarchaeia archaeon]